MDVLIIILVFGAIGLLIGGGIWYSVYAAKKRREAMLEAAESMGLTFFPDGDPSLLNQLSAFKLFNQGRGRKMKNLIQGDSGEVNIAIFDYQYTTGSGKHSQTHVQSVVALQSSELVCPDFTMRPEGMFDKIGGMMGFQDIDFDTHPDFSRMFVLKAPDEQAVRDFFKRFPDDEACLVHIFNARSGEPHRCRSW